MIESGTVSLAPQYAIMKNEFWQFLQSHASFPVFIFHPQGRGDHTFPGKSSSNPRKGSLRKAGEPEAPLSSPVSAPASARFPRLCLPPPPTPYQEPQELRLRRGSRPLGHMPHVWEKKYTPLNSEHMGEGRDRGGVRQAPRGGWAEPPASPQGGAASRPS